MPARSTRPWWTSPLADPSSDTRIAVFVDKVDWHARRLIAAFDARGVSAVPVAMRQCGFRIGGGGLALPGFEDGLPSGIFVRCIPGGSFEQVTLRLGVLHALRHSGVVVCNDARSVECCVDKSMTSFMLERAGVPTPRSWICESADDARAIVGAEAAVGRPLVLKPLFGSQGRGLALVERASDLPQAEDVAGVYYLQRFVAGEPDRWRDWRLLVAGGQVIAAMTRHGTGWITNAHQGARCEAVAPDDELSAMAVAAAATVGADYAGVDVIRDRALGYQVLEVNSMPAWSALQRVSTADITQALADAFLRRLGLDVDTGPTRRRAGSAV